MTISYPQGQKCWLHIRVHYSRLWAQSSKPEGVWETVWPWATKPGDRGRWMVPQRQYLWKGILGIAHSCNYPVTGFFFLHQDCVSRKTRSNRWKIMDPIFWVLVRLLCLPRLFQKTEMIFRKGFPVWKILLHKNHPYPNPNIFFRNKKISP